MPTSKAVTKEALRAEIAELRNIGAQMANLCYNLSQQPKNLNAKLMAELFQRWEAIARREPSVNLAAERLPNVGTNHSIQELARAQGVKPIKDIRQLQSKFPSDEEERGDAG